MSPRVEMALPKYVQIANYIREQIVRGELRPGDEIPSERAIVDEWHVSRITATRALAALRAEGLVEARQGSGTFVRAQPLLNRRARDRYMRSRETGKAYTADERSEIVGADLVPSTEVVSTALGLDQGADVIRRRRVIYDGSGPVEVSISWLDGKLAKTAPQLLDRSRIREGTLAYVEGKTGRQAKQAHDRMAARQATEDECRELGLGPAEAVLVVRHTVYDSSGLPLEYVEATFPPDRWGFEQEYLLPE